MQAMRRVLGLFVLEDVDLANVLVAVGLVPLLVQADQADRGRVAGHLLVILDGDADPGGQLLGARRPAQRGFERLAHFLELGVLAAHEPGNPVHRPQLVEHGAADARHAIGLELDAAPQVEGLDGVHQAEHAGADEVVEIDALRQASPDSFRVIANQRQIEFNELIAHLERRRCPVIAPELRDVHVHVRHHGFLPDEGERCPSVAGRQGLICPAPSLRLARSKHGPRAAALPPDEDPCRNPHSGTAMPLPGHPCLVPASALDPSDFARFRVPQCRLPGPRLNRRPLPEWQGDFRSPAAEAVLEQDHSLRCYRPPSRQP